MDIGIPFTTGDKVINLVFQVPPEMEFRVCDEFDEKDVRRNSDGSFTIPM